MNRLRLWAIAHPTQTACIVTGLLAFATAELLAFDVFFLSAGMPFDTWDIALHVALMALIPVMWACTSKLLKSTALLMAAGLLFNPPLRADEPHRNVLPACIVVGAILVVGAVVVWRGAKKGAKIAKARTNGWPDEIVGTTEYGAAFSWAEDCYVERGSTNAEPVVFTINLLVESVSNHTVTVRADVGSQFTQDFDEFKEELGEHGLFLPVAPVSSEHYELNRQPCESKDVPISFNHFTRTATIQNGGVTVMVESSDDLREWTPLMRLNAPMGLRLRFDDVSSERRFYRVSGSVQ